MPGQDSALIVVAKKPAPGMTKTRLTPLLSGEQAALLYECFLLDTLELVRRLSLPLRRVVAYTPAAARGYFSGLAPDFELVAQRGSDLGERLDNALTQYLNEGCQNAVIISSDSPALPLAHLVLAYEALERGEEVVLGPCSDGGYSLIGLRQPAPRLFREVRMSTPQVTADTLVLAAEQGLRFCLLPTGYDVDDAASLARLVVELETLPAETAPYTRRFLDQEEIRRLVSSAS